MLKTIVRDALGDHGVITYDHGRLSYEGDVEHLTAIVASNRHCFERGRWRVISNKRLVELLPERLGGYDWAEVVSNDFDAAHLRPRASW